MATLAKKVTLIFADDGSVDGVQHNKVWYGELYDDDTVITKWGRVGYDLQSKEFPGAGEGFLIKKKNEKMKKGYTEAKIVESTAPVKGSAPTAVTNSSLKEIARSQILKSSGHPVLDKLIERLVKSNVHKITSSTNITLNDATGLFQTPLGIVTPDAITEARDLLADMMPFVKKGDYGDRLSKTLSSYLRLIPQNIGMRWNPSVILPDEASVQKQGDILDALEASYQAITTPKATPGAPAQKVESVFNVDLDVESGPDAARLEKWYETSKKTMHGYDRIKIRNVFRVRIHDMSAAFKTDNCKEVFHGTSEANCLSILKSGLKVSPPSTAAIAGKMWGNGVYGAINSSKSLGYTMGRWGQASGESGWLFICQFAMGKIHYPKGYGSSGGRLPPTGTDSVWATVANTGLHHDELIVYANNRVNITFLLECK